MTDHYDADAFNTAHLDSQVICVHACGYENEQNEGDAEGNPPTNHWSIFLEMVSDASVKLDISPGYGPDGLRGKIVIASKAYKHTKNFSKIVSFPIKVYATVQSITDVLNANGRDRYNFTEEIEGCRFWVSTVILDIETAGLIEGGSKETAWEAVSCYWRYPSGNEPREVKKGTFY